MLFWILFLITTGLVAIYVVPFDLVNALIQFAVLTCADVAIMGILSLIFADRYTEALSELFPVVKVTEDTLVYQNRNHEQITVDRKRLQCGGCVEPDAMEYYEIISYEPSIGYKFWLWDLIEYECDFIEHLRPFRYA
jgi:hypothetical protein